MQRPSRTVQAPEWLILIGASAFIFVLAVSAYWDTSIRWLHFLQSWMYLAAIILSLRHNRWGYFVGISAALFWNYATLFANTFFYNGLQALAAWIHTGRLEHPDLLISVPAWSANLLLICGCLWAYARLQQKNPSDVARLLVSFAVTTGFFALAMAVAQPRYLSVFHAALHPHLHLPW